MKIERAAGPGAVSESTAPTPAFKSARERAIAKLSAGGPAPSPTPSVANLSQSTPVPDPNKVAVEDMAPIRQAQEAEKAAQPNEIPQESQQVEGQPANQEPPKAATKEEAPLSSQYAQLARKEKALRFQAQELKRQQAEFQAQKDAANPKPATQTQDLSNYISKDQLKQDLWSTLSEMGITYDQVTQQALNAPDAKEVQIRQLEARLEKAEKAYNERFEKAEKAQQEQQSQAYQEAVSQLKTETKRLVFTDPEFETIKATNSVDDVVELIERTYAEDKYLMSVEEAAKEVENHLVEEAMKLTQIKKIQSRLKPQSPQSSATKPQAEQSKQPQQASGSKTLTNGMGVSRPLSPRERAILAFENKLTKK